MNFYNFKVIQKTMFTKAERTFIRRLKYVYADSRSTLLAEGSMRRIIESTPKFEPKSDVQPWERSFTHLTNKVYKVPKYPEKALLEVKREIL